MIATFVALGLLQSASPPPPAASRARPRTIDDAAWVVSSGSSDVQFDARDTLVVANWPSIAFHSARDGRLLRGLWIDGPWTWAACGDMNADGTGDLLLADSFAGRCAGLVRAVSGLDGAVLFEQCGSRRKEVLGIDLLILGDLDGDGRTEFALAGEGPSDAEDAEREFEWSVESVERAGGRLLAVLRDHSRVDVGRFYRDVERRPPVRNSFVSARSGKDGSEIWRTLLRTGNGLSPQSLVRGEGVSRDVGSDSPMATFSDSLCVLHSVRDGSRMREWRLRAGVAVEVGDLDGDQEPDFALRPERERGVDLVGAALLCVSGASGRTVFSLPYHDPLEVQRSPFESGPGRDTSRPFALGDLDGDGIPEIGLGLPWFHLESRLFEHTPMGPIPKPGKELDLDSLSLSEALWLIPGPTIDLPASGCALVFSGKTRQVEFGVWGKPGSNAGLGQRMLALPDFSGDGLPDLLVVGDHAAYAFVGPGREPK